MPVRLPPLPVIRPKKPALDSVRFASDAAHALAKELGLVPADFRDLVPSGRRGFTTGDVRAIAEAIGGL